TRASPKSSSANSKYGGAPVFATPSSLKPPCSSNPASTRISMASSSPGVHPSNNSIVSSLAASANPKPAAASPHSSPSKKNYFSPTRKSIAPVLSTKPAARSKPSPPSSAAPTQRGDPQQNFPYTSAIEWIRRDNIHDRSRHLQPRAHFSRRAGANPRRLLGRSTFRPASTHERRSRASQRLPHPPPSLSPRRRTHRR